MNVHVASGWVQVVLASDVRETVTDQRLLVLVTVGLAALTVGVSRGTAVRRTTGGSPAAGRSTSASVTILALALLVWVVGITTVVAPRAWPSAEQAAETSPTPPEPGVTTAPEPPAPDPRETALKDLTAGLANDLGRRAVADVGSTSPFTLRWQDRVLVASGAVRTLAQAVPDGAVRLPCAARGQDLQPGVYLVLEGRVNDRINSFAGTSAWSASPTSDLPGLLLRPAMCRLYLSGPDVSYPRPALLTEADGRVRAPARYSFTVPSAGLSAGATTSYPRPVHGLVIVPTRGPLQAVLAPAAPPVFRP